MHIVDKFTDLGLNLIGVPKYIDNDFSPTPMSHSAVTFATETIGCLRTTGSVHDWVMVIKVLGRNAGWIALGSGLVGGADVILIPEIPFQRGKICQTVHKQGKHGRKFSILCVAECAKPSVRRARCP